LDKDRTWKTPRVVTETSGRAMSSEGVPTNTHFSVVEVLGTILVAVYNLTAQDRVRNAISAGALVGGLLNVWD